MKRASNFLLLVALLLSALAILPGGRTAATGAIFVDNATVSGNTFTTASCFSRWWWDAIYQYRRKITVTTGTAAVPSGYSVQLDLNHAQLVQQGKSLASGDDQRLLYWNQGSCNWLELDRVLGDGSAWNNASTRIWFKTQAAISANTSDDNYYLYYGNASAINPPANKSNVYVFWDGFESGNLNKWTVQIDGIWSAASDQARSGSYSLKATPVASTQKWITANGINEANVLMDAYWRMSTISNMDLAQGFRTSATTPINQYETNLEQTSGWDIAKMINGSWTEIVNQPAGQNPQANVWTKITTIIVGTNMRVLRNGTQIVPASGWANVGTELSSGSVGFRAWNILSGQAWWIDDVVVRKYVNPEPTTALGAEEPVP